MDTFDNAAEEFPFPAEPYDNDDYPYEDDFNA